LAFLKDSKHYCYICVKKHDADELAQKNWAEVSKQILKEQEDDQMVYYGGRYSQESASIDEEGEGGEEYDEADLCDEELDFNGGYGQFDRRIIDQQCDQRQQYHAQLHHSVYKRRDESSEVAGVSRVKVEKYLGLQHSSDEDEVSMDRQKYIYLENSEPESKSPHEIERASIPFRNKTKAIEEDDDIIIAEVDKKSWKWRDGFNEFYEEDYDADVENDGSKPPTEEESKYNSEDEAEQIVIEETHKLPPVEKDPPRCAIPASK
jgi:hypothetical protein